LVDGANAAGAILDARARLNVLRAIPREPVLTSSETDGELAATGGSSNLNGRSDRNVEVSGGNGATGIVTNRNVAAANRVGTQRIATNCNVEPSGCINT
jgi:hypothetical protein